MVFVVVSDTRCENSLSLTKRLEGCMINVHKIYTEQGGFVLVWGFFLFSFLQELICRDRKAAAFVLLNWVQV